VIIQYMLHGDIGGAPGTSLLFGLPIVVAVVAALVTASLVALAGWRAGYAAAALGAVLLGSGLIGDLLSHQQHDRHRREILTGMMELPSATAAHQLFDLETAEAQNVWHLVSAAGQGLLVTGLAGTILIFRRRERAAVAHDERTSAPLQRVA
jgi:hypothetical protein